MDTTAHTPAGLLRSALDEDAARPFTTFYDDATGERVELSVATFHNWVAKTANLLRDELGAQPGDRLALLLPAHWQAAVWAMACWEAGVVVVPGGDPGACAVAVAGPEAVEAARACPGERVAVSLLPLGGRFPQLPPGFVDYAAEVAGQGDRFAPYQPVSGDDAALAVDGVELTGRQVVRRAAERAREVGLGRGARVLSAKPLDTWEGLADGLLAPLAAGASVVLCRNLDRLAPAALERRLEQERVTARV
ncbi:TIGR03089 family protein [Streptomyces capparidis]